MRQNAANWLEVADRVHKFRRDQLTAGQTQKLVTAVGNVKQRLKEKADASRLKMAVESLEGVLRDTGGRVYPVSTLVENIEFFLVAAIVILGLRAYFLQPFKIPTNSMWPSYYGMTSEVFPPGEEPGLVRKAARLLTMGATNHSVTAPADGQVFIRVFPGLQPAFTEKTGRSLFIFPTAMREYAFKVGGKTTTFTVPADFQGELEQVFDESFGEDEASLYSRLQTAILTTPDPERSSINFRDRVQTVYWLPLGKTVRRGDKILSFDILTGDLLFVDRMSYNFVKPKVGSGFVFRTGRIENLKDEEGDKYFVKRLVGVPGDVLEIKAPALYRNGEPITGSTAFAKNAGREGLYPGYTNVAGSLLSAGDKVTVPANSFFALGDNSPRSKDSRYWGFVPEKEVVGRPLFIYYPLTSRWGPAR